MRIVFMGSPEFAVPSLKELAAMHTVVGVYCQPPKPAGRGLKLTPCPVHKIADAMHLPVFTPARLKGDAVAELAALKPDLICVAAYGLLLPQSVLDIAPCLNVHPSALPRWRGAAPIQHTLMAGDLETEVCIMHMEKSLDTGPVYYRVPVFIWPDATAGDLHDDLAQIGATALAHVVNSWDAFKGKATPQAEDGVTYAHKIDAAARSANFNRPAAEVVHHIMGLSPWPGVMAMHDGIRYKLVQAEVVEGKGTPGHILHTDHGLVVACATGAVRLRQIQREGKQAMDDTTFLNGHPLPVGSVFTGV